jgi:hypothetical protein
MRSWIVLAGIAFVIGGAVNAESQTWRVGDYQPFSTRISAVPTPRQQSIIAHIQPTLAKLVKEDWLKPDEAKSVRENLLVREVATASGHLLLVQSWGTELCGGVGNCEIWVLGDHDRLLLEGSASEITILRSVHFGKPSILMSLHDSAADRTLVWYRFDGVKYRVAACALKSYGTSWETYSPPRIEYLPCSQVL